jgi:Tol biopolymer transport system component
VFASNRDGKFGLYQKRVSGSDGDEPLYLTDEAKQIIPFHWSPDDRFIAFVPFINASTTAGLHFLRLFGDRKPFAIESDFYTYAPRFSADGKWIAYVSGESGTTEIFVDTFPQSSGSRRISTNGGIHPRWRRDGKELYFWEFALSHESSHFIMAVDIQSGPSGIQASAPKPLFERPIAGLLDSRSNYDVSPSGQRFLLRYRTAASPPAVTAVLNWASQLEK